MPHLDPPTEFDEQLKDINAVRHIVKGLAFTVACIIDKLSNEQRKSLMRELLMHRKELDQGLLQSEFGTNQFEAGPIPVIKLFEYILYNIDPQRLD